MQHSKWSLMRMEKRGIVTSLEQLVPLFLTQPWVGLALWAVLIHYWLVSHFSASSCPKPFWAGLLLILILIFFSSCNDTRLPHFRCKILYFTWLDLMTFTWAHSVSLARMDVTSGWWLPNLFLIPWTASDQKPSLSSSEIRMLWAGCQRPYRIPDKWHA